MEIKEIDINGKKFKIKELTFEQGLEAGELRSKGLKEVSRYMIKCSIVEPILSEEDISNLSLKEGNELMKKINELNGFNSETTFQTPNL